MMTPHDAAAALLGGAPSALTAMTHLLAVACGVATGYYLARRGTLAPREGNHMPWRTPQGRRLLVSVAILVTGLIVIALGVQQAAWQRAQDQDRAEDAALIECLQTWGAETTEALRTRSYATSDVEQAQVAYDDAVRRQQAAIARVVLVVGRLRESPPAATEGDLDDVLVAFPAIEREVKRKRAVLAAEKADARDTRAENPFKAPVLSCSRHGDGGGD